jgi:hypothetical protein
MRTTAHAQRHRVTEDPGKRAGEFGSPPPPQTGQQAQGCADWSSAPAAQPPSPTRSAPQNRATRVHKARRGKERQYFEGMSLNNKFF